MEQADDIAACPIGTGRCAGQLRKDIGPTNGRWFAATLSYDSYDLGPAEANSRRLTGRLAGDAAAR